MSTLHSQKNHSLSDRQRDVGSIVSQSF